MRLSIVCTMGLIGVLSFASCQKHDAVSSIHSEPNVEQSTGQRKDIDLSKLSFLGKEEMPKELLRSDGLRAFKPSSYGEYDFSQVSGVQDPGTGNSAYVVPRKGRRDEFLSIAYSKDFGVTSVVKMVYTKDENRNIYNVRISDVYGTELFEFSTDLKSYKVLKSNGKYESLRASDYAWACGLSLGAVGTMWGTVIGLANPLVGAAVGLGYTAFSIWACDESKLH